MSAELACPKCGAAMETLALPEADARRCRGCGGLWFGMRGEELLKDRAGQIDTGNPAEGRRTDAIGRIDTGGVADPTIIRLMLEQATQKNAPALRVTTMLADGKAPVTLTYPLAGFPQAYAACAPGKY